MHVSHCSWWYFNSVTVQQYCGLHMQPFHNSAKAMVDWCIPPQKRCHQDEPTFEQHHAIPECYLNTEQSWCCVMPRRAARWTGLWSSRSFWRIQLWWPSPPSPVTCPAGIWGGCGVLITTLPLFDPRTEWPSDPQVRGPTAVCWKLWLMVQMSPLTHGEGLGNCLGSLQIPLSSHIWKRKQSNSEGKHSQTFSQPTACLLASEWEELLIAQLEMFNL